jgi:toxin ParE1/3/4
MRIVWLPYALRDLQSIVEYQETFASKDIAHRTARRIVNAATMLAESPYLGHPSESLDGIHELHIPKLSYLLPYRVIEERVEILRVFHEAQNRPSTWQENK